MNFRLISVWIIVTFSPKFFSLYMIDRCSTFVHVSFLLLFIWGSDFFNGHTRNIWRFPCQGVNPSNSCGLSHSCFKARSFNALCWSGIKPALPQLQATVAGFLTHCAKVGTPWNTQILSAPLDEFQQIHILIVLVKVQNMTIPLKSLPLPSQSSTKATTAESLHYFSLFI